MIASIERDASARNQILTLLHQALGNSFVHQIVAALESPRGTSAPVETPMATTPSIQVPGTVRVVAADELRVRSSPSHGDNVIGLLPADPPRRGAFASR